METAAGGGLPLDGGPEGDVASLHLSLVVFVEGPGLLRGEVVVPVTDHA